MPEPDGLEFITEPIKKIADQGGIGRVCVFAMVGAIFGLIGLAAIFGAIAGILFDVDIIRACAWIGIIGGGLIGGFFGLAANN